MHLLLVNPNTSEDATAAFLALAQAAASPATRIRAATGRFGAKLMRSPAELAIGAHALLDAVAAHGEGCEAVVVAAFGDYGASAAAQLFRMPVVTIAEAAFATLRMTGQRYSILTVAPEMEAAMARLAETHRASETLTAVRGVPCPPGDAAYAATAAETLARMVAQDRPDTVLVVGPPLAALMPDLGRATEVPLIEGVSCAVRLAEAIGGLGLGRTWHAPQPRPGAASHPGLADPLAAALASRS